jgi:aspartate aminotransferase
MSSTRRALSPWACQIAPSPTLAVDARAKAMKTAGEDVCSFAAGEPDFDTPDFVKEACARALREGHTKYAPTPGIDALRRALADRYRAEYGLEVAPAQVVVSPGGKFSCYLALLATCGPGDEVIVPAPYWVSYPEMVKLTGATPVVVAAEEANGFKLTAAELEAAITPRTRLVILNSPSNPTGAVYRRAEMEALVAVVLRHGLWLLSDEIYERLTYDGVAHHCPATFSADAAAATIVVSGFSKTFSMTGWRLGTLVAPAAVAKAVAELQSQTSSNATTFAQYGALAALTQREAAEQALAEMRAAFDRRRQALHAALTAIPGVNCVRAEGAFYLFPSIASLGLDSQQFCSRLLEQEKVAAVPGSAFGADACLRLSYATSDATIAEGARRLAQFCASLR